MYHFMNTRQYVTGWWFGTFLLFHSVGNNDPN